MEVEIVGSFDILPNGGREEAFPVIGREEFVANPLATAEEIVAALFRIGVFQSLLEPGVFVGSVVQDKVDDDA
jgi:hypothetical protein